MENVSGCRFIDRVALSSLAAISLASALVCLEEKKPPVEFDISYSCPSGTGRTSPLC